MLVLDSASSLVREPPSLLESVKTFSIAEIAIQIDKYLDSVYTILTPEFVYNTQEPVNDITMLRSSPKFSIISLPAKIMLAYV